MKQDLKLEKKLKKLGFKKKWLEDHSGYWYQKKFKFRFGKVKLIVETERKLFTVDNYTYMADNVKLYYSEKNIRKWSTYLTKLTKVKWN